MRNYRPLAAGAVLALTVPLASAAVAATPATTTAKGSADSILTLLTLGAGGHNVSLVGADLIGDTLGGTPAAHVKVIPVSTDGTATGTRDVGQGDPLTTIPTASTPVGLGSLLSASSPPMAASAKTTDTSATSTLTSGALGSASLLGLPIKGVGSLDLSSLADPTGAKAGKQIVIGNFALPSLGKLLAGLGLDTSLLPIGTLEGLVSQLKLGNLTSGDLGSAVDAVTGAQAAVDTAQGAVDTATSQLSGAVDAVNAAIAGDSAISSAVAGLNLPTTLLADQITNNLTALSLIPGLGTLVGNVDTAQTALDQATGPLDLATATLDGLVGPLTTTLTGLLGGTPLAELASLNIGTIAATGSQHTADVTGTVSGLKILGTDVLQPILGSSSANLTDLDAAKLGAVNGAVSQLLAPISSVLTGALPGLQVPVPVIQLLQKTTSTDPISGLQGAAASVTGMSLSWSALALPTLPNAAPMRQFGRIGGQLPLASSIASPAGALSLKVATVTDSSRFQPAGTTGTGTTGTPDGSTQAADQSTLPRTGGSIGLALAAVLLTGLGLASYRLRRRGPAA